jgi:hypothetical protein
MMNHNKIDLVTLSTTTSETNIPTIIKRRSNITEVDANNNINIVPDNIVARAVVNQYLIIEIDSRLMMLRNSLTPNAFDLIHLLLMLPTYEITNRPLMK